MNIIKFKDIIKVNDPVFNTCLKGKYAYWICCRYVMPLDKVTLEEYVRYEQDKSSFTSLPNKGKNKFYWDTNKEDLSMYIDSKSTDEHMSPNKYLLSNKFATDGELTVSDVKKFRNWLASTLLSLDRNYKNENLYKIFDEYQVHILEYYEKGMYDECVKWLSQISPVVTSPITTSSCGCGSMPVLQEVSVCAPFHTYKMDMHSKMAKMFGDLDFWVEKDRMFLLYFKQYIDNIINLNLPLSKTEYTKNASDCICQDRSFQNYGILILKKLSQSLEYICTDEIGEHRNYAAESFKEWAQYLYESMYWN